MKILDDNGLKRMFYQPSLLLFLLIPFFFISCCDKKTPSETLKKQVTEMDLMDKYGSKDLNEEQVDSIINSIKWTTNSEAVILGDKDAKKGGILNFGSFGYPVTLRTYGQNCTYLLNSILESLVYETLLKLDPVTLKYLPSLADKWCISADKETYFYHIDTSAKWQDGEPVSSFDIVATWDLIVDDGLKEPVSQSMYLKFKRPVALSKKIVMIKPKEPSWRAFFSMSTEEFFVLPEHIIGRIQPSEYMSEYNNKMMIGSGPYSFEKARPNEFIILKRDTTWWGREKALNKNLFNLDKIRFSFYSEETVMSEKFKKGDVDVIQIERPLLKKWKDEYTADNMNEIKYNHIIRQRVYINMPDVNGFYFNLREEPFDDIRVRKAIFHLFNREVMLDKFYYNEFRYMDSYFAGLPYENKNNPKIRYNQEQAIKILEEAGYSQKNLNDDGYIVKDGKVFGITLNVYRTDDTRVETLLQEEFKKVGIKLNLKRVTWASTLKDIDEFNFKMIGLRFTIEIFPNPELLYHSEFANKKGSFNIWGLKDREVDGLLNLYYYEYDMQKRINVLRKLDSIITRKYMTALLWYEDNMKILYWNKFGMPKFGLSQTDYNGLINYKPYWPVIAFWWRDKELESKLEKVKGTEKILPAKPYELKAWKQLKERYK
jgi:microcin C transport system substrate-binding protein